VTTPSQTAGPFLAIGTKWLAEVPLVGEGHPGTIGISGRVIDGAGDPVTDGLIEFWQADPAGRFPPESGAGWLGLSRALTGVDGRYRITTLKPGPVEGAAPHIDVSVFARGLMQRLVTRLYFSDEEAANATDPVLSKLPPPSGDRLLASSCAGGYEFDIYLQGELETVFFTPWAT
jgi:protocatechuate 3,4-dioxygenase alpha subunit